MFRSYYHPRPTQLAAAESGERHIKGFEPSMCPLWQIGRATSAAPTYFAPMVIPKEGEFLDGGVAKANNPVELAYYEVKQMHGGQEPEVVISVGTGSKSENTKREIKSTPVLGHLGQTREAINAFKRGVLSSHDQHMAFLRLMRGRQNRPMYHRFDLHTDAPVSIGDIKLDEFKTYSDGDTTLTKIDYAVDQYVNQPRIQQNLEECAERLVDIRRHRQETERWERFACSFQYQCKEVPVCEAKDHIFTSRLELRQHLNRVHGMVWQVRCLRHDGSEAHPYSCYWDQCGEENTTAFDTVEDFETHLQQRHGIAHPRVMTPVEIEGRLDQGRMVGMVLSPNPTTQRTRTFRYNE